MSTPNPPISGHPFNKTTRKHATFPSISHTFPSGSHARGPSASSPTFKTIISNLSYRNPRYQHLLILSACALSGLLVFYFTMIRPGTHGSKGQYLEFKGSYDTWLTLRELLRAGPEPEIPGRGVVVPGSEG